jgi:predicted enzyme related to lactoylglutathione lyase
MPMSVPPGMRLELCRARLLPGAQDETDRWMTMLHDRYDECLDTLSAERMVFEATFRHTEADGSEWIYHLSLYGEGTSGLDLSNPVDAEHDAYARRCKEPGWEDLRPVLMLAPRPVLPVLEGWARDGALAPAEEPGRPEPGGPGSVGQASGRGHDAGMPERRHHAIGYVELTVTDLEQATHFYAAAFGWQFTAYGPGYAGIQDGSGAEVGGLRLGDEVRSGGPLVLLWSADLDASVAAVRSAGGQVVQGPYAFPGGRRFHFADPSGNELGVWADR